MSSVRTILAGLFTALGGFFLLALTAGAGFAIYLATAPDSALPPADADAVSARPLMRAEATAAPRQRVAWVASTALTRPLNAPAPVSNRRARIRQLQKALARAECYNGPISGIWSDASKDAMRGFVQTANAELPVDRPDEALIALVESNEAAKCITGRAISTGALGSSPPPSAPPSDTSPRTSNQSTMLGRPWAPAEMLLPPKDATADEHPIRPATTPAPIAEMTASNDPAPVEPEPVSKSAATIHFEGDKPLAAAQPIDPSPVASDPAPEAPVAAPAKPKKTRTAKRRRAKYDDVQTTISKGFESLQRSIASMF